VIAAIKHVLDATARAQVKLDLTRGCYW